MDGSLEIQKLLTVLDVDGRKLERGMQDAFDKSERRAKESADKIDKTLAGIGSGIGKGASMALRALSGDFGEVIDLATGLTSAGLKLIPVVGVGLSAAFDQTSGAMLSAIDKGFTYNDMVKRQSISMTALTGDAKLTRTELEQLSAVSSKTEFGKTSIFGAAREMQNMGREAKLLPADLLGMAAASSALSASTEEAQARLSGMAGAFAKVLEMGKVGSRDVRRLVGSGIPVFDILAEQLGVSKKRAEQLVGHEIIDADDFITALTTGMAKKYGAASSEMLQLLGVQQAKLSGGMAALDGKAFKGAYDTTVTGLGGVNKLIRSDAANSIAASLNAQISPVTGLIQSTIKAMESGDLTGGALKIGQGIIEGVQSGIQSKVKDVAGTGVAAVSGVIDSAVKFLDINSPSRVTAAQIGVPMAEGIASGFAAYIQGDGKKQTLDELEKLLQDPRIKAMLEVIKRSEVGNDPNPYTRLFGKLGHLPSLDGIDPNAGGADPWPGMRVMSPSMHKMVTTHTLGPYQAEPRTYRDFSAKTGIQDVQPHSQDLFAVWDLLKHPEAFREIMRGDAKAAMDALKSEWESFAINSASKKDALAQTFNALVNNSAVSDTNPMPVRVVSGPVNSGDLSEYKIGHRASRPPSTKTKAEQARELGGEWDDTNSVLKDTGQIVMDVDRGIDLLTTSTDNLGTSVQQIPLIPLVGEFKQVDAAITKNAANVDALRKKYGTFSGEVLQGLKKNLKDLPTGREIITKFVVDIPHNATEALSHAMDVGAQQGIGAAMRTAGLDFAQLIKQAAFQEIEKVLTEEFIKLIAWLGISTTSEQTQTAATTANTAALIANTAALQMSGSGGGGGGGGGFLDMFGSLLEGGGGGGSFGPDAFYGLATGGDYTGGGPLLVGEQGPELLFPKRPGYVVSNSDLRDSLSSNRAQGQQTVNVFVTVQPDKQGRVRSEGQIMVEVYQGSAAARRNM
jgi:tape measure domain-containing protein